MDPDVILLQEVDIFCKRSGNRDHMQELCKSLELLGGFVCEFEELDNPIRKLRDAVRCNIYFVIKGFSGLLNLSYLGWWCTWKCYSIKI